MYSDLKLLFGSETPSVRKFNQKLSGLSADEKAFYLKAAHDAAFCNWDTLNLEYREFLKNLFKRDWQQTLNYLHRQTVMGQLVYKLQEPELLQRLIALLEGKKEGYMPSFIHLSFGLHLGFSFDHSVEYFGDQLRTHCTSTDDLCELMDRIQLTNEPGHLPTT